MHEPVHPTPLTGSRPMATFRLMALCMAVGGALLVSCASRTLTVTCDPAPPRFMPPMSKEEVIWFDTRDNALVVAWASGDVTSQSLAGGQVRRCLQLPGMASPDEIPILTTFALNKRGVPLIAFSQFDRVTLLDLRTGSSVSGVSEIPCSRSWPRFAFADGGSILYVGKEDSVQGLDVRDGHVIETIPTPGDEYPRPMACLFDTGTRSQVLPSLSGVRALDKRGTVLWQTHYKNATEFLDPTDVQPRHSLNTMYNSETHQMIGLCASDGKELWSLPDADSCSLRAVSDDGARQAFFLAGEMRIYSLPSTAYLRIQGLSLECDAVFTPDAQYLLCLPALPVRLPEGQISYEPTPVSRASHRLCIVDAGSGETVRSFVIELPPQ
jgi:hypothetical protein